MIRCRRGDTDLSVCNQEEREKKEWPKPKKKKKKNHVHSRMRENHKYAPRDDGFEQKEEKRTD